MILKIGRGYEIIMHMSTSSTPLRTPDGRPKRLGTGIKFITTTDLIHVSPGGEKIRMEAVGIWNVMEGRVAFRRRDMIDYHCDNLPVYDDAFLDEHLNKLVVEEGM